MLCWSAAATVVEHAAVEAVEGSAVLDLLLAVDAAVSSSTMTASRRKRRQRRLETAILSTEKESEHFQTGEDSHRRLAEDTIMQAQSVLEQYSSLLTDTMVPGQSAVQVVLSEFRLHVQKLPTSASAGGGGGEGQSGGGSLDIPLPSSALETVTGEEGDSLTLPESRTTSSDAITPLSVAVYSMRPQVLNEQALALPPSIAGSGSVSGGGGGDYDDQVRQFHSNALSLQLSQVSCATSPATTSGCNVDIVLQLSTEFSTRLNTVSSNDEDLPFYETSCGDDDFSVHNYSCPDSTYMLVSCNGTASDLRTQCPKSTNVPVCNALVGLKPAPAQCSVLSVSNTSITCSCPLDSEAVRQQRQRQRQRRLNARPTQQHIHRWLQSSGGGDGDGDDSAGGEEDDDEQISVSYVAMLETVQTSFVETVLSSKDLSGDDVARSWTVLVTLGMFILAAVLAIVLSHFADQRTQKSINPIKNPDDHSPQQQQNRRVSSFFSSKRVSFTSTSLLATAMNIAGGSNNTSSTMAPRPLMKRITATGGGGGGSRMIKDPNLKLAEDALPSILGSRSFTARVAEEIKHRHRWIGIYFHYSSHFPRSLRVASLVTNVVIMLFIQSLTYALTNPDDGQCETYNTRPDCLADESPYATGESKCAWSSSGGSSGKGSCSFVEPDNDWKVILFVAIFSAVISTPVALLADWIIMNILSAPTQKRPSSHAASTARSTSQQPQQFAQAIGPNHRCNETAHNSAAVSSSSSSGGSFLNVFGSLQMPSISAKTMTTERTGGRGSSNNSRNHNAAVVLMSAQAEMRELTTALALYRKQLSRKELPEFDGELSLLLWLLLLL